MAVFQGEYHLDRIIDAALAMRNKISNLSKMEALKDFVPNDLRQHWRFLLKTIGL